MKKVLVLGDVHAQFNKLSELINKKRPKIILQVGDWGFWPHEKNYWPPKLNLQKSKIHFCCGNHSDHNSLKQLTDNEVHPGIFYQPRGSTLTLPDGRVVLFMGGALSVDKHLRTPGYDWFPEEMISQQDIYNLPDVRVDIVISHTAPRKFDISKITRWAESERVNDSCRDALDVVFDKYKPKLWYFGHFHEYLEGQTDGCRWFALNRDGGTGWWRWLEDS